MSVVLKERSQTETGLLVVKEGDVVETMNRAEQVVHRIELSAVKDEILIHRWLGYRTEEQFKEITDGHFIQIFEENGCKKILVDISEMTGTFTGVNNWMAEYLMPKLIKKGFRASAVVLPQNIFVQLSAEQWEEKTSGFINGNFEQHETALEWLKKQ